MIETKSIAIVGGGIGGLTLAIALRRKGVHAIVYEGAPVLRPVGAGIVLAGNAIKAFEAIGLDAVVKAEGNEIKKFSLKDKTGHLLSAVSADSMHGDSRFINSVALHRADLQQLLVSQLPAEVIKLNKSCVSFKQTQNGVDLTFHDGSTQTHDYVIAADGIHSVFRNTLVPDRTLRYSGYTCWRGIVSSENLASNVNEAAEFWGAGKRFGVVPLSSNRLYWYATIDAIQRDPKLEHRSPNDLIDLFSDFHQIVREVLQAAAAGTTIKGDISDIKPLKKFAFGNIVLLGDAAHSSTPNLGQGACMAIEDAVVLAQCINADGNVVEAFQEFERKRLERTTKIVNASYALGKLGQLKNPVLVKLRNAMMKWTPKQVSRRQLEFLHDISFK